MVAPNHRQVTNPHRVDAPRYALLGAFQGSTWYFRHPSSVAALLRRVDARTCVITRAKFPLPGNERTPFIIPNSAGLQREGCAILKTFHGRTK